MIYHFGPFILDLARQELLRAGQRVDIEPMAFDLLQYLIGHSDRLVTKEELIDVLWDGRAVTDSALSTCVRSARRAVDDSGASQAVIKTVHGKGFRWGAPFTITDETVGLVAAPDNREKASGTSLHATGRPSIAILPFSCLGDPGSSATLSEAIPHELIAAISRLRWIAVIARGSSFRFRSESAALDEVRSKLGVRYCLTGGVEIIGRRAVVDVELADTFDGQVIWADRFQSSLAGIHEIREMIVAQVVCAVEIQIPLREAGRARLRAPENFDAWTTYHLGLQSLYRFDESENDRAIALFKKAVTLEPDFARAHAALSFARFKTAFMHYSGSRDRATKAARSSAERAIELDPMDPFANFNMGRSLWLVGDLSGALGWLNRSTSLSPNFAQGLYARAWTEMVAGSSVEGRRLSDKARSLSPLDPMLYAMLSTRALSLAMEGRDHEAAQWVIRAANEPGAHDFIWMIAVIINELAGDRQLAEQWARRLKQARRDISQKQFFRSFPFRDAVTRERFSAALTLHGIP